MAWSSQREKPRMWQAIDREFRALPRRLSRPAPRHARLGCAMASVLLGLIATARPARAEVLPLAALEALALERRPALQAGSARARASHAEVDKALSAYYPRISLEAGG